MKDHLSEHTAQTPPAQERSAVGMLSDLMLEGNHPYPPKAFSDKDKNELLKLGKKFFAGKQDILEQSSGDRDRDLYVVMERIADLSNRFVMRGEVPYFPEWVYSSTDHIWFQALYQNTSPTGSVNSLLGFPNELMTHTFYYYLISNAQWDADLSSRITPDIRSLSFDFWRSDDLRPFLRTPHRSVFNYFGPLSSNAPAYQTEDSLYLYKPFGMTESLKIVFTHHSREREIW